MKAANSESCLSVQIFFSVFLVFFEEDCALDELDLPSSTLITFVLLDLSEDEVVFVT